MVIGELKIKWARYGILKHNSFHHHLLDYQERSLKMNNLEKVMDDVIRFILGDRRDGIDRRVKKSKRKRTRRKATRRNEQ